MTPTRRIVLKGAVAAAVLAHLPAAPASTATRPLPVVPRTLAFTGARSPNGWAVNVAADAGGSVWARPVSGAAKHVAVSVGDADAILVHVVRRFHYEVADLGDGDVVGFRAADGLKGHQLNHASGSAVDILPEHYRPGVKDQFYPAQLAVVRDILAECRGVLAWGGDFAIPDEGHFEIALPPTDRRVTELAAQIRRWNTTPGRGAGVLLDPAARRGG